MECPNKIGLYGGSFDPLHFGHLRMAEDAFEWADLDLLYWVPAAINPHKSDYPSASFEARVRMIELAIAEQPGWAVLDVEGLRPGPSYTWDTVQDVRKKFPNAQICLIIGSDQLPKLSEWGSFERLKENVHFLVMGRPGFDRNLSWMQGLSYDFIEMHLVDISSTEIRRRIEEGLSIDALTVSAVVDFIKEQKLYQN